MSRGPEEGHGLLDRAVDLLASAMDAVGLNGTRLRWKWNRRRRELAETSLKTEILLRSARGRHKMCPSCRALVPRSARVCSECQAVLATVRAPGLGRLVSNVIPGATAATSLLLLVNGALFVLMFMAGVKTGHGLGLFSSFDPGTMIRFGSGLSVLTIELGEWWRLVTPIFLHGGLLHFAFNSYALLQLGPVVEAEYGTERFAIVYLVSGIVGNVFSQLLRPQLALFLPIHPGVHTVGASGAICGLIGLLLAYGMRRGGFLRAAMTQYAIYLLIFSFIPGVDLLCHLGGFVGGFLLGWIVPAGPLRVRAAATILNAILLGTLALVLYAFYQVALHGAESAALVMQRA